MTIMDPHSVRGYEVSLISPVTRYDSDLPDEADIRYMGYSARWREAGEGRGWRSETLTF